MDTINTITTAASKAIWGESQSHEEPVSGKMGDVAAGEPYDAGNIESNEAALSPAEKRDTERLNTERTGTERIGAGRGVTERAETETPVTKANDPSAMSSTVVPTVVPTVVQTKTPPTETAKTTSTASTTDPELDTNQKKTDTFNPAKEAPSSIAMMGDSTKAQNDTRPPPPSDNEPKQRTEDTTTTTTTNEPTTTTKAATTTATTPGSYDKTDEAKQATTNKPETEEESASAVDISGPGPRPLSEVARKHGGNAAAATSSETDHKEGHGQGLIPSDVGGVGGVGGDVTGGAQERRDSGKGLGGEDERSENRGSGEEYIKSSGLVADGGDFDASRPGAGREADRLLEEKGVVHKPGPAGTATGPDAKAGEKKHHLTLPLPHHRAATGTADENHHATAGEKKHHLPLPHHGAAATSTADEHHHATTTGTEAGGGKEKVGLKDKIKAKLHMGSTSA